MTIPPIAANSFFIQETIKTVQEKRAQANLVEASALLHAIPEEQRTADCWFWDGVIARESGSDDKVKKCFKMAIQLWTQDKKTNSAYIVEFASLMKLLGESNLQGLAQRLVGQSEEKTLVKKISSWPLSFTDTKTALLWKKLYALNAIRGEALKAKMLWQAGNTDKALTHSNNALRHLFAKYPNVKSCPFNKLAQLLSYIQMSGDLFELRGLALDAEYVYEKGIEISRAARLPHSTRRFLCSLTKLAMNKGNFLVAEQYMQQIQSLSIVNTQSLIKEDKKLLGDFLISLCEARFPGKVGYAESLLVRMNQSRDELLQEAKSSYQLAGASHELIYVRYLEGDIQGAKNGWERLRKPTACDLFRLGVCKKDIKILRQALEVCRNSGESVLLLREIYHALIDLDDNTAIHHALSINMTSTFTSNTIALPDHWVMITASICGDSGLRITRWEGSRKPISVQIADRQDIILLSELQSILNSSNNTLKTQSTSTEEKKSWWAERTLLDARLKQLVQQSEEWLDEWKALLAPQALEAPSDSEAVEIVHNALNKKVPKEAIDGAKARLFLAARASLSDAQFARGIRHSISIDDEQQSNEICIEYKSKCTSQAPVILVLGKEIELLPWESLSILRTCQVTRMPSVSLVEKRLKESLEAKNLSATRPLKGYYVLNPANNLARTQKTFENLFPKQYLWDGVKAVAPTQAQFAKGLQEYDIFVYCGHGSGIQYLPPSYMAQQIKKVQSTTLLMGCSSVAKRQLGKYDSAGIIDLYMESSSPAVIGTLWDVTDADIDRLLQQLLAHWLNDKKKLLTSVSYARDACKLKYLNAAGAVVYGMPACM